MINGEQKKSNSRQLLAGLNNLYQELNELKINKAPRKDWVNLSKRIQAVFKAFLKSSSRV